MRRYDRKHPGIRIDKITVAGFPGLIFAIGVAVMFIIGLPELREFALVAVVVGTVVGGLLYFWHNQTRW